MTEIDILEDKLEKLRSYLVYLKSQKLSRGLNDHDQMMYENLKKECSDIEKYIISKKNVYGIPNIIQL